MDLLEVGVEAGPAATVDLQGVAVSVPVPTISSYVHLVNNKSYQTSASGDVMGVGPLGRCIQSRERRIRRGSQPR